MCCPPFVPARGYVFGSAVVVAPHIDTNTHQNKQCKRGFELSHWKGMKEYWANRTLYSLKGQKGTKHHSFNSAFLGWDSGNQVFLFFFLSHHSPTTKKEMKVVRNEERKALVFLLPTRLHSTAFVTPGFFFHIG